MRLALIFILILPFILGSLTPEDRIKIKKIRERLTTGLQNSGKEIDPAVQKELEKWLKETPDGILQNWLLFFDEDMDKIEAGVLRSMTWRKENRYEKIREYKPPEYVVQNFPFNFSGVTPDGKPVFYIPAGKWPLVEAVRGGYRQHVLKYLFFMIEHFNQKIIDLNRENEVDSSGQFITIVDLEGLSFRQVTSIRVLGLLTVALEILQINYPLIHSNILIVNAPDIFSVFMDIAKTALSSKTLSRMQIFGSNKAEWSPILKKIVPESAYPKELV